MSSLRHVITTVILCALLTVPLSPVLPSMARGEGTLDSSLYMLEPQYGRTLLHLDAVTLQTIGGVTLGGMSRTSYGAPQLAFSPDGTRVASEVNRCQGCAGFSSRYITIRIFSLVGTQLARFHPQVPLDLAAVSGDGASVSGLNLQDSHTPVRGWYTLNTASGRVTARVKLEGWSDPSLYDGTTGRLFVPTFAGGSLTLTAYAASSGNEIGRLTMDGVQTNVEELTAGPNRLPIMRLHAPAIALSPDGRQLAVVQGDRNRLTVIDARTLHVIATHVLSQPASPVQRLFELTGLLPVTAYAKGIPQGVAFTARFSRDGRSLYLTGTQYEVDAAGTSIVKPIGVRLVDVASGEVRAEALTGFPVLWLGEAADRSALYALTPESKQSDPSCPCVLHRLDPTSLQITAERRFEAPPQLYVVGGGITQHDSSAGTLPNAR